MDNAFNYSDSERVSRRVTRRQSDPLLMVVDASPNSEARYAVIGLNSRWNLLYVVHIERDNDMIRIISARKATRKEREYYEN